MMLKYAERAELTNGDTILDLGIVVLLFCKLTLGRMRVGISESLFG